MNPAKVRLMDDLASQAGPGAPERPVDGEELRPGASSSTSPCRETRMSLP